MTEKVSDRELEAILKLVELTQAGAMKWRSVQPWGDLAADDDVKYSSVFTAEFESKKLRIFFREAASRYKDPWLLFVNWRIGRLARTRNPANYKY